jgi:hypothetical protein
MSNTQREAQLFGAFLKTIRSVGVTEFKKTSMFLRNIEEETANEKQAA